MSKTGKIIIWSVVAAVLTGVLVWGIIGGSTWNSAWSNFTGIVSKTGLNVDEWVDKLPDDAQKSPSFTKEAAGIKRISLQFVEEDIIVRQTDDSVISVSQESNQALNEDEIMHYGVKNGELMVQSGKTGGTIFNWSAQKDITVVLSIPRDFGGILDVRSVSGDIEAQGVRSAQGKFSTTSGEISLNESNFEKSLTVESVSGEVTVRGAAAEKLKMDSMSGSLRAQGRFKESTFGSTSGDIQLLCSGARFVEAENTSGEILVDLSETEKLEQISLDSVSGELVVRVPEKCGFTVSLDTVSGELNCDFPLKGSSYLDGAAEIDANTISGSLNIENAS